MHTAIFAVEREANSELLIRGKHNRRVGHELKYLQEASAQVPASGNWEILVPKQEGKPPRTATLSLRYASFTILPPQNSPQNRNPKPITLNVVFALEENPPTGIEAINWLLLTTLDVNNFEVSITLKIKFNNRLV